MTRHCQYRWRGKNNQFYFVSPWLSESGFGREMNPCTCLQWMSGKVNKKGKNSLISRHWRTFSVSVRDDDSGHKQWIISNQNHEKENITDTRLEGKIEALKSTQDIKIPDLWHKNTLSTEQHLIVLDKVQNNNKARLYPKLFITPEQLASTFINPSWF